MTTITISAACNVIAYDPQADSIYGYTRIGAGLPADLWHGRHPYVAHGALENAVPADVAAWAEAHANLFKQATGAGDDAEALLQLEDALHDAVDVGEIRRYYPADEWVYGDVPAVIAATLTHDTLSAAAAAEVASADDSVVLHADDVAQALRALLAERLDELTDDDPEALDDDETAEVAKIRALLVEAL
jgi:hypothetical protein